MTNPHHPLLGVAGAGWIPDETPPEGQRLALRRLATALRGTIELLMNTEAPEEEVNAAAEAAEAFSAQLARFPRGRTLWGYAEASNAGTPRAFFDSSPVIGLANPIAPPLTLRQVDDHIEGTATFGSAYEGPPGHVHGGFVAAAMDEVLGMVQSVSGQHGMTGTLTIRYRRPTPLHTEVQFLGKVDRVEGRKIFTAGTLSAGGTVCAEAEGIFVAVDFARMQSLADGRTGG